MTCLHFDILCNDSSRRATCGWVRLLLLLKRDFASPFSRFASNVSPSLGATPTQPLRRVVTERSLHRYNTDRYERQEAWELRTIIFCQVSSRRSAPCLLATSLNWKATFNGDRTLQSTQLTTEEKMRLRNAPYV